MSWNDRKIFQTVKFRVALWYAVLFALSAAISFLLVFIYLKNSMLRQTDHKLTSYADRVLYDYLTNNKFKRFYRADSSRTLPGNGLGLSLVHAIVEAHHGKIHVASSEKGSIFTVCLPLC